jgi:hypothetical protein
MNTSTGVARSAGKIGLEKKADFSDRVALQKEHWGRGFDTRYSFTEFATRN